MDQEKKNLQLAITLLLIACSMVLLTDFLLRAGLAHRTGIVMLDRAVVIMVMKARTKIVLLRAIMVLAMIALAWLRPPDIKMNGYSARETIYPVIAALLIVVFMSGYQQYLYYNLLVYPAASVALFWSVPMALRVVHHLTHGSMGIKRVTTRKGEYTFSYPTSKGRLCLHDIRTATFIEGSAKAGKTASLIIPTIVQAAQKQFAGLIYDYEGNLREPQGGVLTRVAYTALSKSNSPVRFAVLNFMDLSRTIRCNPLSENYIKSYNHALELATVIMVNINRSWSRHKDFWSENAIAAYAATIWFFRRNIPEKCTIPHVTEFLLHDFRKVLRILNTDQEVAPYIRPILGALERDASGQIAGAESSTQFPVSKMRSPEVYYVLNPEQGRAFDLDITSKASPTMLSVCNFPELQHALAPAIGAVIQVCKGQMNRLGKHKSIFLFDETPTVYIDKADKIPAEARKKNVCAFFAVQTYDQLVRDYGTSNARVIRNACGNLFTGISSLETADMVSRMMGEERAAEFTTTSSESGHSVSRSEKDRRILKASEVAGQPTGHFSGRVLGGEPPYFSAQFIYQEYPLAEIPPFSQPVKLGDPAIEQAILNQHVEENYTRIKKQVTHIIGQYEYLFVETHKEH